MRKVSKPRKKREPEPWEGQTRGTCAIGVWSTKFCNLDHEGKPFVKVCEHATVRHDQRGQTHRAQVHARVQVLEG